MTLLDAEAFKAGADDDDLLATLFCSAWPAPQMWRMWWRLFYQPRFEMTNNPPVDDPSNDEDRGDILLRGLLKTNTER